ncbi:MAG: hypothetical protein EA349_05550 [Halomonadaceae bacterium]|nr:MAG: hypothetical protein EA349_05550 [Halomonadaceae bacterium]
MTPDVLFKYVAVLLFVIGLYGMLSQPHMLRKILAGNLMSVGVFLFMIATAARNASITADPVPHAMVITGIVVSISVTALALMLVERIQRSSKRIHLYWWFRHPHDRDDEP